MKIRNRRTTKAGTAPAKVSAPTKAYGFLTPFVKDPPQPGIGTAELMGSDPEMEARIAEQNRRDQEVLLVRLYKIEQCYQSEEIRALGGSWLRQLDREVARARKSIRAGDVFGNRHFREVQVIHENLSYILSVDRDRGLRVIDGSRAGGKQRRVVDDSEIATLIQSMPNERRKEQANQAEKRLGVKERTFYRALARIQKTTR